MLVVLTGLPGTGKSELAAGLATAMPAAVLSADPIDDALVRAGVGDRPDIVGYEVMKALTREHLSLGLSVVIDAVNPFKWVRDSYTEIAAVTAAPFALIATLCSDPAEHRRRVESRHTTDQKPINWVGVQEQVSYYEPPSDPELVLDAVRPSSENIAAALSHIKQLREKERT